MARPRAQQPLRPQLHADAIGEHLEAVSYGKINPRLLINVPPGKSKSLLIPPSARAGDKVARPTNQTSGAA